MRWLAEWKMHWQTEKYTVYEEIKENDKKNTRLRVLMIFSFPEVSPPAAIKKYEDIP